MTKRYYIKFKSGWLEVTRAEYRVYRRRYTARIAYEVKQ